MKVFEILLFLLSRLSISLLRVAQETNTEYIIMRRRGRGFDMLVVSSNLTRTMKSHFKPNEVHVKNVKINFQVSPEVETST